MSVQLVAIKFNHDPNAATSDALNIRRNATQFVSVPEWTAGVSVQPEDSPAAYSIADTQGNTITIQAKFRRAAGGEPVGGSVEVRALDADVDPPGPGGCLGFLIRLLRAIVKAIAGNVLGDVKARSVTFGPSGESGFETFELQNVQLAARGVGARTTRWRWQYRENSTSAWVDMVTTQHRIYSVLAMPTAPWQQAPYATGNVQLPWTDVLDRSCAWATLATAVVPAATRVTQAIYDLGPARVEYDCPGGGGSAYTVGSSFNCTAFLARIGGAAGNGKYVNCTDCATFTATFANILGADLWESRMGYSFGLNPLLAIGSAVCQPACGWSGFSYHEVAWTGNATVTDRVYDACLQVNDRADPGVTPCQPRLPTDMVFGATNAGQYRDKLATVAGRPNCNPQPTTRVRRTVF